MYLFCSISTRAVPWVVHSLPAPPMRFRANRGLRRTDPSGACPGSGAALRSGSEHGGRHRMPDFAGKGRDAAIDNAIDAVQSAIVFFTVSTSCFRLKGFGRKLKVSPSGRFLRKASSA